MLQMRLEGDLAEAEAFVTKLRAFGIEVAAGTVKSRGGFVHAYSTVRMADYTAAAAPDRRPPIRVQAETRRALPSRRRR